jgi:REP element-mobilizing transposase RayT
MSTEALGRGNIQNGAVYQVIRNDGECPGIPHHVAQRGNRRERTLFGSSDDRGWLGVAAVKAGAETWAYCRMPNHVHAVSTPTPPVHLAPDVLAFLAARAQARGMTLDDLVNALLKQDIERIEQAE